MQTFLFLLVLSYIRIWVYGRFYVLQLFTGEMFMMREILYAWWERGEKLCPGGRLPLNAGELMALNTFLKNNLCIL